MAEPATAFLGIQAVTDAVDAQIQRVFRDVGPLRDRLTDWRLCTEEPWRSLANAVDVESAYLEILADDVS